MGYRATVLVDMDHLNTLKLNIDNVIKNILGFGMRAPVHCENVTVLEKDNANVSKLVIIGNYGDFAIEELSSCNLGFKEDASLHLLEQAAEKFGYTLVKK